MVTVLDNLEVLDGKCDEPVYVLPLMYNALDSEHAVVSTCRLEDLPEFNGCYTL